MRTVRRSWALAAMAAPWLVLSCSTGSPASPGAGASPGDDGAIGSPRTAGSDDASVGADDAGGDGGGAGDSGCAPYAPPPTASAPVSFVNDVLPLFNASCAFGGCHGPNAGSLEFLADRTSTPAAYKDRTYKAIVNQPSLEDPTMVFVKPGDPAHSFLMHKMDDDLCSIQSQCVPNNALAPQYPPGTGPCGGFMPASTGAPLGDDKRTIVRSWIAQGATEN